MTARMAKTVELACGCQSKEHGACSNCGKKFCFKHLFFYVDESNTAITQNSPELCDSCYRLAYGWTP